MQQFTFSFVMSALNSNRVKQAVASSAFFGATGALRGACARLESFTRTLHNIQDKYPERAEKMRSSAVFAELNKKADAAANRAATIHAIAEEHGVMLRLEFEPPMPKPKTHTEIEQLAELTRMTEADVAKHINNATEKQYAEEVEAAALASSLFWSACADRDAPIKFELVAKAIERMRLNLLTWSSIDFAELALIASDETALNEWMNSMSDDPSEFSDNDEDAIEEQHRKAEIKALNAHANHVQAVAYLDAERRKAAKTSRKRTRVKAA